MALLIPGAADSPHGLTNEVAELIRKSEKALEDKTEGEDNAALAAEAASQGAFNEETGEINWDCPVSSDKDKSGAKTSGGAKK